MNFARCSKTCPARAGFRSLFGQWKSAEDVESVSFRSFMKFRSFPPLQPVPGCRKKVVGYSVEFNDKTASHYSDNRGCLSAGTMNR